MSAVSYIWFARSEISIPPVLLFCLTPICNSIKSDKMEAESKWASQHSKIFFFVNIKTISTKEVNLSTKLHMHILKGLSKNEKLLKKLLWNRTETLFRNQVWNIHKIKSLIYCLFLNINTKISTLQQKYNIRGASPLVLVIPNYFCDNLKPAKLQISKPLTSNLNECAVCKPVFSITTCNLICQLNFNIYKSSHWKWNVPMLRKNHIGPLPRILLIRSWIPFLLTI